MHIICAYSLAAVHCIGTLLKCNLQIIIYLHNIDCFDLYMSFCCRYQFFLQVKRDILQGRLPVPFDLASELCAYAVQCKCWETVISYSTKYSPTEMTVFIHFVKIFISK